MFDEQNNVKASWAPPHSVYRRYKNLHYY